MFARFQTGITAAISKGLETLEGPRHAWSYSRSYDFSRKTTLPIVSRCERSSLRAFPKVETDTRSHRFTFTNLKQVRCTSKLAKRASVDFKAIFVWRGFCAISSCEPKLPFCDSPGPPSDFIHLILLFPHAQIPLAAQSQCPPSPLTLIDLFGLVRVCAEIGPRTNAETLGTRCTLCLSSVYRDVEGLAEETDVR